MLNNDIKLSKTEIFINFVSALTRMAGYIGIALLFVAGLTFLQLINNPQTFNQTTVDQFATTLIFGVAFLLYGIISTGWYIMEKGRFALGSTLIFVPTTVVMGVSTVFLPIVSDLGAGVLTVFTVGSLISLKTLIEDNWQLISKQLSKIDVAEIKSLAKILIDMFTNKK